MQGRIPKNCGGSLLRALCCPHPSNEENASWISRCCNRPWLMRGAKSRDFRNAWTISSELRRRTAPSTWVSVSNGCSPWWKKQNNFKRETNRNKKKDDFQTNPDRFRRFRIRAVFGGPLANGEEAPIHYRRLHGGPQAGRFFRLRTDCCRPFSRLHGSSAGSGSAF